MENSVENSEIPQPDNLSRITVDQVDVGFLPIIYDIIRSLERDPHDTSQKAVLPQDISQRVIELQKKLDTAREQVRRLAGVEYSQEEQLDKLEAFRKQLRLKQELLLKYRNMCSFDIPKP